MLAAAERWGGGRSERPYLPRASLLARWRDGEAHFLLEDVGPGTRRLCELGAGRRAVGARAARARLHRAVRRAPRAARRRRRRHRAAGDPRRTRSPATAPRGRARASRLRSTVLLGFRDRAHAEGAALLPDAHVATDDGSRRPSRPRHRPARERARRATPTPSVYACGPPPRCSRASERCAREREVPAQLALEAGMACGFGACFGCVVPSAAAATCACASTGPWSTPPT